MDFRQWVKAAQANGWLVAGSSGQLIRLQCACVGCPGAVSVPMAALGAPPGPCGLDHVAGYAAPVYEGYQALIAELRRRRLVLGLSQEDIDAAAGWAPGYTAKAESHAKTLTPPTLQLWAQTVGLRITTTPAALPAATIAAINGRRSHPYAVNQARFKHAG